MYHEVLTRAPNNRRALRYLGMAHIQYGAIDAGISLLGRSVALPATDAKALSDLRRARTITGNTGAAPPVK